MSSIVIKGYFLGFYFWLDAIATLSLISDITWIWYPMVGINDNIEKAFNEKGEFDPNLLVQKNNTAST